MLNLEGEKIGQINGLAAIDLGEFTFANPTKITATTYAGRAGIVNIENEAELSGEIHDKAVQIIIGYLGHNFAQEFPLSFSCRLCFEQNYSGIDGDSATAAEVLCIMSSLAKMPIKQSFAITGSMNQFGEIQAVGSINAKIEGFFKLFKQRGLKNGGVVIPIQNIMDLNLSDEVVSAVENNSFEIYAIESLKEAAQLMLGDYDKLERQVLEKLKELHELSSDE